MYSVNVSLDAATQLKGLLTLRSTVIHSLCCMYALNMSTGPRTFHGTGGTLMTRALVKPRKQHEAILHGKELPMDRLVSFGHHTPFRTRTRRSIAQCQPWAVALTKHKECSGTHSNTLRSSRGAAFSSVNHALPGVGFHCYFPLVDSPCQGHAHHFHLASKEESVKSASGH
jgi:hypothetical protein